MSDVHESAKIILELYSLRREAKLREARDWVNNFNPKSADDIKKMVDSPEGSKLWMVAGYWEMACALVNRGAIDAHMFADTTSEHLYLYAKLQPYLAEMRKFDPHFLSQTEKVAMNMPNAKSVLDEMRKMMADMAASSS